MKGIDIMKNLLRKTAAGIAALTLCLTSAVSAMAAEVIRGDADGNGVVQTSDIISLKTFLLNAGDLTEEGKANSDMNSDGILNVLDFILMKNLFISDTQTSARKITLNGTEIKADEGITVDGTTVTVSESGDYIITGEMTAEATIVIAAAEEDKESVNITLSDVRMTNTSDTPCIMVENADKTKITFTGTNVLTNTYDAADAASAAIYAKDDITFTKGSSGTLEINTNAQMGIYCNNDIKFNGGSTDIKTDADGTETASADAVKAKGNIEIGGGEIKVNAAGDGIKSSKSAVTVTDGTVNIKSGKDALQAETSVSVSGGDIFAAGDRGITAGTELQITGGNILATSTDPITLAEGQKEGSLYKFELEAKHEKSEIITVNGTEYKAKKKFQYILVYRNGGEAAVTVNGQEMKAAVL